MTSVSIAALLFILSLMISGSAVEGWCVLNSGCQGDEYCKKFACLKVCDKPNVCGANAHCKTTNHEDIKCMCNKGYEGEAKKGCRKVEDCKNKCAGPKTTCAEYEGRAFCGCQEGFAGNPYNRTRGCVQVPGLVDAAKCWSEDHKESSPECTKYFINQRPKKDFSILLDKASWFEALKLCEAEDRMLAIIEHGSDQESLQDTLISKGIDETLWLAGSDLKRRGSFQWLAGTTFNTMEYTKWDSNEPSGENQRCVAIRNRFLWASEDCTNKYPVICMNK